MDLPDFTQPNPTPKSRKERLIDAIEKVIDATAKTARLEKRDFPSQREFAKEVVGFLYRMSEHDKEIDEKRIIT